MELLGATVKPGKWHAELNILSHALKPDSGVRDVVRWGISWAGKDKGIPCPNCAPAVSGVLELGRISLPG
ncbi:hypothetical protein GCM10027063_09910 [Promicromonospora xylanilytica]